MYATLGNDFFLISDYFSRMLAFSSLIDGRQGNRNLIFEGLGLAGSFVNPDLPAFVRAARIVDHKAELVFCIMYPSARHFDREAIIRNLEHFRLCMANEQRNNKDSDDRERLHISGLTLRSATSFRKLRVIASRASEGTASAEAVAVTERQAKPGLRTTTSAEGCW